ncbi:MAG: hypothetical protein GXP31_11205 [Kiritimatiellaeota bacterium]|nr:hypothetical protein [Kiritimatiellota bacterium]
MPLLAVVAAGARIEAASAPGPGTEAIGRGPSKPAAADSPTPGAGLTIQGTISRAVTGGPVKSGEVEVRWPGHGDVFRPIVTTVNKQGQYRVVLPPDKVPPRVPELSVAASAKGFALQEVRLPSDAAPGPAPVVVDLELKASTLDGVLDIFSCCVLSWSILTVMLPAFLLGAAVKAFVPSHQFLRLLGPDASQPKAYAAAVGSGMVLSLCSCNVVPLFVSIWRSGAGVGPAFAFLYAGPAINTVSMIFAAKVIGLGIGLWRVVAVAILSVIVGLVMARVFGNRFGNPHHGGRAVDVLSTAPPARVTAVILGLLLGLLILGSIEMSWSVRLWITLPMTALTAGVAVWKLERDHIWIWMRETWRLILLVIPILIPAVLVIGFFAQKVPLSATSWLAGTNSVGVNALAAAVGAFMYFPILTEVPFVKTLLKVMDMNTGPAMALLLTAPGLSLPGMIIVCRDIGIKRLTVYVVTLVGLATMVGLFFGSTWGQYLCNCRFQ